MKKQQNYMKYKEDKIMEENLKKIYKFYSNILEKDMKGYCFLMPKTVGEFINESNRLKHCVKSYAKSMAKGETIIIFMREESNRDQPFYTIEYKDNCIVQIQGFRHSSPPDNIKEIAHNWLEKVNKQLIAVA